MKRLLALLLAMLMLVSLVGCSSSSSGSDDEDEEETTSEDTEDAEDDVSDEDEDLYYNTEGYPIVDEEITITFAGSSDLDTDLSDQTCIDEYAERLGIRLDGTLYDSDSWSTELTLMIASDDLPDMLCSVGLGIGNTYEWGDEGYFLDISQYTDLMPNMLAYFEEYPDLEAYVTTTEGHIYGLSGISIDYTDRIPRTFIKQTWLDDLGLEVPESLDEFYEIMTVFKEQDANGNGDSTDEIPFFYGPSSGIGGYRADNMIQGSFGIYSLSYMYKLQANEDGEVYLAETTTNYQAWLSFMAQMYEEGLINNDCYTITFDEACVNLENDLVGFFGTWSAPYALSGQDIEDDKDWTAIVALSSEYVDDAYAVMGSSLSGSIKAAINANTEYPEAICRFLDYFYTEEGMYAATKGYEGINFDLEYDETVGVDVAYMYSTDDMNEDEYRYSIAVINGAFNFVEVTLERNALFELDIETLQSDEIIETYGWMALMAIAYQENGSKSMDTYPTVSYTTEESDARTTYVTDISTYLETAQSQFIIGEMDVEDDWDTYLSTLESMGLEEVLEIEQEAYDNYLAVLE